ncbi:DUF1054 family protein [Marinilactibacillus psychrotolerans]|uniref:DUF1054 family protein n=2 Tax=Marinilactibacillus psychrotolerans TaxID=191770 RepID=A0ABW8UP42_9LACT|nr:DUF1054 family protein [Marinilactibacillus psychrotolerans]GEQ33931.1 hypothetical protein B795N_18130 [Marinilactibacillus psychrotolerans]SJN21930.1 hypothetical protein FM115_02135 [Marinilactibacillus psychrotolerans 42ea]
MRRTYKKEDFEIFQLKQLEERMEAIRERIQPIFQEFGDTYSRIVEEKTGYKTHFHIAQHRRRTTNPPESTWSAIGGDSRGYKKYPHIQMGINEEHIFIFVSIIDQPLLEKDMGKSLLENKENWIKLKDNFVISGDHTKSNVESLTEESGTRLIERMITVKKGEILIGRIIPNNSPLLDDQSTQQAFLFETISQLIPLYKQLLDLYEQHNLIDK